MAKDDVKITSWISWLSGAILTAITLGVTVMAYAFATFETKDAASQRDAWLDKRLERIEFKIDQLQELKK